MILNLEQHLNNMHPFYSRIKGYRLNHQKPYSDMAVRSHHFTAKQELMCFSWPFHTYVKPSRFE